MNITKGSTVKVTLTYSQLSGVIGVVERTPDDTSDLYLVRMPNGSEIWLFQEELELHNPSVNKIKEKIETKIEEFKEKLPENGRLVHEHQFEADGIIAGLQLALDILNEEE